VLESSRDDAAFAGEGLPLLDDVLARFGQDVIIDVEVKSPRDEGPFEAAELGTAVAQAIVNAGLEERVFVTSFNPYILEAIKEEAPTILRGQLTGTFQDADLSAFQKAALKGLWLNGKAVPDILGVEDARLTPSYIKKMKKKGYRLFAWTVNDPERMKDLIELGVDGIITDEPDVAREALGL